MDSDVKWKTFSKIAMVFFTILFAATYIIIPIARPFFSKKPKTLYVNKSYLEKLREHPEENTVISLLSAKYDVSVDTIESMTEDFHARWRKRIKDVRSLISEIAEKNGLPEKTVGSILVDENFLISDSN